MGVLVMVMVRLMTCFTQTGSPPATVADRGDSHHFRFASTVDQSAGEKADRRVLLLGDSVAGDQIGDWGICRRGRTALGLRKERADDGGRMVYGERGFKGADAQVLRGLFGMAALPGWVIGVGRPEEFIALSKRGDRLVDGVEIAGDMVLRKSVYAVGGVNGVLERSSSSCLTTTRRSAGSGLRGSCEGNLADSGNVAELGVMRAGRVGFVVDVGVLMVGGSRGFPGFSVAVGMMAVGRGGGGGELMMRMRMGRSK